MLIEVCGTRGISPHPNLTANCVQSIPCDNMLCMSSSACTRRNLQQHQTGRACILLVLPQKKMLKVPKCSTFLHVALLITNSVYLLCLGKKRLSIMMRKPKRTNTGKHCGNKTSWHDNLMRGCEGTFLTPDNESKSFQDTRASPVLIYRRFCSSAMDSGRRWI